VSKHTIKRGLFLNNLFTIFSFQSTCTSNIK
jgi:hypothetical protein